MYKGTMYPEQRETVVIMMPDSWSHCPGMEAALEAWQVSSALQASTFALQLTLH